MLAYVVVICLVLTSLAVATAGIQIPALAETAEIKQEKEVIVKEGHRKVEIEYEGDDGSTKVNIFPQEEEVHTDSPEIGHGGAARELVCDAFGKCKHKVAQAFGKSKEVLSEKAHQVKDKVGEVEGEAKHRFEEVKDVVRETGGSMIDESKGKARGIEEKVKEAAQITKEKVKGVTKEAIDTGNTLQADVRRNSTQEFEIIRRYVVDFCNSLSPFGLWASGIMKLLGFSVAYGAALWVSFFSSYITADALPRRHFAVLQSKIYPVYFRVMASGIGMLLLSHSLSSGQRFSGRDHFIQALNLSASLLVVLFNLKFMEPRANKIMLKTMKLEKEEGRGMERPTDEPSVVRNIDSLASPLGGMSKSAKASVNPSQNPQGRADSSAAKASVNPSQNPQGRADSSAARSKIAKLSEQLKKLNSLSSFLNITTVMLLTWHLIYLGQIIHA